MADKKPWLGQETLPAVWIWICFFFNLVGILAVLILIIAEMVILVNNFNNYTDQYGHNYPARGYVGEAGSGYVGWTNAPKHTLSAVWMLLFQFSVIIFATLVIASDLAWRKATYNKWGGHYVSALYAVGIMEGSHNKGLFYFVVANGFLKIYIVVLYMSQSFYGLSGGSHSAPALSRVGGGNTVSTTGGIISTGPNGATIITTRDLLPRIEPSVKDPEAAYGTELWAEWAGWVVLGSILPSVIAFIFLVPWAAKKNEENKPKDAEK